MKFTVTKQNGAARCGVLEFRRGEVQTPAFMPVGAYGTVTSGPPEEVAADGPQIQRRRPVHLGLGPGSEIIRKHGGLHEFMNWHKPILTDSGGFQVFSLAAMRQLSEEGVRFQSPVNGDDVFLTPEKSIEVQHDLNADVTMIFDECTPYPASEADAKLSMDLSLRWARRSRTYRHHAIQPRQYRQVYPRPSGNAARRAAFAATAHRARHDVRPRARPQPSHQWHSRRNQSDASRPVTPLEHRRGRRPPRFPTMLRHAPAQRF